MNKTQGFSEFGQSLSPSLFCDLRTIPSDFSHNPSLCSPPSLHGIPAEARTFLLSPPTHLQPLLLDFIHLLFLHQRQEFPRLVDGAHEVLQQTLSLVDAAAAAAAAVFVWERTETVRAHLQASWDPAAHSSHADPRLHLTQIQAKTPFKSATGQNYTLLEWQKKLI